MNHALIRYLEAKRSVDERALSTRVRNRLLKRIPDAPRVLEVGCGTGATVPRLVDWGIDRGTYRGVDTNKTVVEFARSARAKELRYQGHSVTDTERGFVTGDLSVSFDTGDAFGTLSAEEDYDLVIGHAFADLVSPQRLLSKAESALRPSGVAYFPITFDGETIFQPDHPADPTIVSAYHEALDSTSGRDSRAGRHLANAMTDAQGTLLSMAGSDWVVRPRNGTYPADEAYFLGRILGFVEQALGESSLPELAEWVTERKEQLDAGDLLYVAHQYDLLYQTDQ